MQFSFKYLMAATIGFTALSAQADIVPTKSNVQTEENSLVSRVLSKDSPSFNSNFNQLNGFKVNTTSNDKVLRETVATRIDVPVAKESVVDKLNNVASSAVRKFSQTGVASWYGRQFHGRKTASGETFNMNAMTAAHPTLPLNCYVRVTNERNGKSVVVKINDRGPFHGNRVLDLSHAAAQKLGMVDAGSAKVRIERVDGPNS
ncbi:MAG: septal ring lytic transglycosylase RlpA family protein [Acinetobacter sp.]|nr:septal ring lytic transglycosylase RlpA family protein [Acinetobacter sp.]